LLFGWETHALFFTQLLVTLDCQKGYFSFIFALSQNNSYNMVQKTYFKTKDYCKVKFSLNLENAETVEILGLNSDWKNSVVMSKKKDGSFSCDISLPKNTQHEFKYRINETEWMNEPNADTEHSNVFGGKNSVIIL
jgi:hypothetical protein